MRRFLFTVSFLLALNIYAQLPTSQTFTTSYLAPETVRTNGPAQLIYSYNPVTRLLILNANIAPQRWMPGWWVGGANEGWHGALGGFNLIATNHDPVWQYEDGNTHYGNLSVGPGLEVRVRVAPAVTSINFTIKLGIQDMWGGWHTSPILGTIEVLTQVQEQTVTATISSNTIERGAQVTGQATGARAGNPYDFTVISGGVGIIGDSSTGQFFVTGNTTGPFEIRVYARAGGGYNESSPVYVTGTVLNALRNKITVTLNNKGSTLARNFKVFQDGAIIHQELVPADTVILKTLEVPTLSPVSVLREVNGIADDPIWIKDGLSQSYVEDGEYSPTRIDETQSPSPAPPNRPVPPAPKDYPTNNKGKTVWQSIDQLSKNSELKQGTYAEGVDKLMGPLSAIDENIQSIKDTITGDGETTSLPDAIAAAEDRDTYETKGGIMVSHQPSVSTGNAAAPAIGQTITVAGREVRFSLSPSDMGLASSGESVLRLSKPLILIAACLAFFSLCGSKITAAVHSVTQVNQADSAVSGENILPGVSQVKTWGAAGIITGIIVAFSVAVVALVATVTAGIGVTLSGVGNVALSTIGAAVSWLEIYVPVTAIITLTAAAATVDYWLLPLYLGSATLVKFIKA